MRRSRRKGQLRRVSSIRPRSIFADQNLLGIMRGLGDDAAKGIDQRSCRPKNSDARPICAIAQNVSVLVIPTRFTLAHINPLAMAWER